MYTCSHLASAERFRSLASSSKRVEESFGPTAEALSKSCRACSASKILVGMNASRGVWFVVLMTFRAVGFTSGFPLVLTHGSWWGARSLLCIPVGARCGSSTGTSSSATGSRGHSVRRHSCKLVPLVSSVALVSPCLMLLWAPCVTWSCPITVRRTPSTSSHR